MDTNTKENSEMVEPKSIADLANSAKPEAPTSGGLRTLEQNREVQIVTNQKWNERGSNYLEISSNTQNNIGVPFMQKTNSDRFTSIKKGKNMPHHIHKFNKFSSSGIGNFLNYGTTSN
mmetsp:Transcript_2627/g.4074  ORF Transcript_2627/g.4074 Transcript_2627/m.4074 type:complete len:118 (-) Transcript_2627:999-1352(-)